MLTEEIFLLCQSQNFIKFHHPQHKKIKINAYRWVTTTAAASNNYKSPKQRRRSRSGLGDRVHSRFGLGENKKRLSSRGSPVTKQMEGESSNERSKINGGESGNEANGGGVK